MSMPPPRFLAIAVGCVVKVSIASSPKITIYGKKADIMGLHTHFTGSVVDAILALKSSIDPGFDTGDIVFTNRSVSVTTRAHQIRVLDPGAPKPEPPSASAHQVMKDGFFYWLEPAKKTVKKTAKKSIAKKK